MAFGIDLCFGNLLKRKRSRRAEVALSAQPNAIPQCLEVMHEALRARLDLGMIGYALLRTGYRPVYICCRVGAHIAVDVYAMLNRIPWLASRSMFGVFTSLLP